MTDNIDAVLQAEQTPISPAQPAGEPDYSEEEMPQGLLDMASGMMSALRPDLVDSTEAKEIPEDSVEDEVEAPELESTEDIDEDIEVETDEDEEDEVSEKALPDSIVEYDELKEHTLKFRVGGENREMTIDQIASELGQVKAASKAQSEVKNQKDEVAKVRKELEQDRNFFEQQQKTAVESQKLAQMRNRLEEHNSALNLARQRGDVNAIVRIKDQMDQMTHEYHKTSGEVKRVQEETESRLVGEQMKKLDDLGYGTLLNDTQRFDTLTSYVNTNLTPAAAQAANYDATLLVAIEKARLWDSSQNKKGKLKASGKTLKSGGKKATPKKTMTSDEAIYQHALNLMKG